MQSYDFNIPTGAGAGTTRRIDTEGRYLYYYSGSAGGADATLAVRGMSTGYRALLLPGQGLRLPQNLNESAWLLTNYANQAAIIGRVVIGAGEIQDNRSTGVVEVVDGGYARSLGGTAFISSSGVTTTVATNSAALQLWNQSASKNLVVEQITLMSNLGSSQPFTIGFSTAALATLFGQSSAKKSGVVASTSAQLRTQEGTNPALFALFTASLATIGTSGPYVAQTYTPKEPIIVSPGAGLIILDGGAAAALHSTWASFEHYEQAV